jgi:ComF family protein
MMSLRLLHPASSMLQNLASQCAVCRSWPARRICAPCVARFALPQARCSTCALGLTTGLNQCATCVRRPPPLHACFAAVPYAYPWSDLMVDYKFGHDPAWASLFAGLLMRTPGVAESLAALRADDWLLPLPLSAERLQTRGFNQAWELVKALAGQSVTSATADARLLLRIRNTPPQSQLKREARLQNVKGAFVVEPLRVSGLNGRRVLLVDDVMTSGASLFSAAQALLDAGAAQVTGVVFARTEN